MKFIEDIVKQSKKKDQFVCGDVYLCKRNHEQTVFIFCDGIGSGPFANISAISTANRLLQLCGTDLPMQESCQMVADSMHSARKTEAAFVAFLAVKILNDGQFTAYSFEAPGPMHITDSFAYALKPVTVQAGRESIQKYMGHLKYGDSLLLVSDGVTQAGMGQCSSLGIGLEGVLKILNRRLDRGLSTKDIPAEILDMAIEQSNGQPEDDITAAILDCRSASQLNILTGPPANRLRDQRIVHQFLQAPGLHAICGSSTADMAAREMKQEVELLSPGTSWGVPPEYGIAGIDLVTEGVLILNQVYNILEEELHPTANSSVVERLCCMLRSSDVIQFFIGTATNKAHSEIIFKQIGILPRYPTIQLISEKLEIMGKLVMQELY